MPFYAEIQKRAYPPGLKTAGRPTWAEVRRLLGDLEEARRALADTLGIKVEPDGDGFHAFCPVMKGLHVGGSTRQEALGNAVDGAILYLGSLRRHGELLPVCRAAEAGGQV
jgi:predicted RNase H-like HicB family nuclease